MFRSHRCSNQWLGLRGVCKFRKREKKTAYLAFLDVSKVHGSMWREGLWCKMYGVEEKFVKVCEGLYSGVETRFGVERGLRQGFPLSQLLFNIYMMGSVEELERAQLGVKLEGR